METLETARFRLRPLREDNAGDRALYCALYTSQTVMARIMPPLSHAEADAAFERMCRHNGRSRPGHRHWSVNTRDHGMGAGIVGLLRHGTHVEIGGLLLPAWWNRGVSRETYRRAIDHAFTSMDTELVFGERMDDDHALLIDRLFAPLGLGRVTICNGDSGTCRWELRRSDWKSRQRIG